MNHGTPGREEVVRIEAGVLGHLPRMRAYALEQLLDEVGMWHRAAREHARPSAASQARRRIDTHRLVDVEGNAWERLPLGNGDEVMVSLPREDGSVLVVECDHESGRSPWGREDRRVHPDVTGWLSTSDRLAVEHIDHPLSRHHDGSRPDSSATSVFHLDAHGVCRAGARQALLPGGDAPGLLPDAESLLRWEGEEASPEDEAFHDHLDALVAGCVPSVDEIARRLHDVPDAETLALAHGLRAILLRADLGRA